MLKVNSSRPASLQIMLQRLRLAQPRKRIPLNLAKQTNDTYRLNAILFHPPNQILKRRRVKLQVSQGQYPDQYLLFGSGLRSIDVA